MRREKISGVYVIQNKLNDKIYIGSSHDIYARWASHKSGLKSKKHGNIKLQRAWDKYGIDNFVFKIIKKMILYAETNKSASKKIIKMEQYFLDKLLFAKEKNNKFKNLGYNICRTSRLFYGYKNEKMRGHTYGMKPVYQYDLNGSFLKKWNGIVEASKYYNISISGISNCCRMRIKTSNGFVWRYKKDILNKNKKISKNVFKNLSKKNKVLQYSIEGKFIKEWDCAHTAQEFLKISGNMIYDVCDGQRRTTHGFLWRYKTNKHIDKQIIMPQLRRTNKRIIQYNVDGTFIKEWDSINSACYALKYNKTTIRISCRGQKIRGVFMFKFKK